MVDVPMTTMLCHCGCPFSLPTELYKSATTWGTKVFCPHGHGIKWATTEVDRLHAKVKWLTGRVSNLTPQLDKTERSNRALRGAITRMKRKLS